MLNRGDGRARIFHKDADDRALIQFLALAKHRFAVSVLAFCLMPNHFHVVVQRADNSVLSRVMQWWLTAHVRRHHRQLPRSAASSCAGSASADRLRSAIRFGSST